MLTRKASRTRLRIGLLAVAVLASAPSLRAQGVPPSFWPRKPADQETEPQHDDAATEQHASAAAASDSPKDIRLNYLSAEWSKVLKDIAEATDRTLVADRVPSGRFSRFDRTLLSKTEAIRILNREFEPKGYRLIEQGQFLVLLDLDSLRARYARPVVRIGDGQNQELSPASNDSSVASNRTATQTPGASQVIQLTGHENSARGQLHSKTTVPIQIRSQSAVSLSRAIYEAYGSQAELIDDGPAGLPGFAVANDRTDTSASRKTTISPASAQPEDPAIQFSLGIDTQANRVVVEASAETAGAVAQIIQKLDHETAGPNQASQFVPSKKDVQHIARDLQPVVNQLIAEGRFREALAYQQTQAGTAAQKPPTNEKANPAESTNQAADSAVIGALRGEVTIDYVPGVGFVLRGNEEDVKKVENILKLVEEMGVGGVPNMHLQMLKHVDSEALTELLNSVYEQLTTIRGLSRNDATVAFLAVGKPNAVLVIASADDLEAIIQLIDELDRPVDPNTEFAVFSLKNAIASQVVTMLESFYQDRGGLGARIRAVADARTNSLVVQARPNDLREVAQLIQKIDRDASEAVCDIRTFPLKNAIAEELAALINQAIQSVISPATTGLSTTQIAAAARTAQELQQAKSAILQFLSVDGDKQQTMRSGILADIRVTADPRTNSLIVTAPRQSLDLMAALIKHLDRPADQIAEIKIFTLNNASASTVADILENLFVATTTTNQQGQLGIQVAGIQEASSTLIGLRFSVDTRTNSIIAVGGLDALSVVEAIILRLDEGDLRQRRSKVIRLKNAAAEDVAATINDFRDSLRELQQSEAGLVSPYEIVEQEIIAVAESVTNSLLISATPRYFAEVERLVNELDEAPKQVIIQALLVEVELDNTDEFGVELGFQDSVLFNRSIIDEIQTISRITQSGGNDQVTEQVIVSQQANPGFAFNNQALGNNVGTGINTSRVGMQGLSNFALNRVNSDLGFGGLVLSAGSESVSVLIRALAANRNVEILSRPQIRTLDNQLAQIQVGAEVPRINGFSSNSTTGVYTPIVEQTETGITLSVTPRITPEGIIVMEVVAEKSQLADEGVILVTDPVTGRDITSPVKDIKVARTTVSVTTDQTIVLGGMITKEDTTVSRRVPWLGDLPVIGIPFRYDYASTTRTELLIFLTPRIIDDDEESEMIKQIEAERLHFVEEIAEEIHGPLYGIPAPMNFDQAVPESSFPAVPAPSLQDESAYVPGSTNQPQPLTALASESDTKPSLLPVPSASKDGLEAARLQNISADTPQESLQEKAHIKRASLNPLRYLSPKQSEGTR